MGKVPEAEVENSFLKKSVARTEARQIPEGKNHFSREDG